MHRRSQREIGPVQHAAAGYMSTVHDEATPAPHRPHGQGTAAVASQVVWFACPALADHRSIGSSRQTQAVHCRCLRADQHAYKTGHMQATLLLMCPIQLVGHAQRDAMLRHDMHMRTHH